MKYLGSLNIKATGTIRQNRTLKCPFTEDYLFKKKQRGYYESYSSNHVMILKWNDTKPVIIVTKLDKIEPITNARRYSKGLRKNVYVTMPNVVKNYNRYMGGVDQLDSAVAAYRISIGGKKWYWSIFLNYIDMAVSNSYKIFKLLHSTTTDYVGF